jgi:hypothetical protein
MGRRFMGRFHPYSSVMRGRYYGLRIGKNYYNESRKKSIAPATTEDNLFFLVMVLCCVPIVNFIAIPLFIVLLIKSWSGGVGRPSVAARPASGTYNNPLTDFLEKVVLLVVVVWAGFLHVALLYYLSPF